MKKILWLLPLCIMLYGFNARAALTASLPEYDGEVISFQDLAIGWGIDPTLTEPYILYEREHPNKFAYKGKQWEYGIFSYSLAPYFADPNTNKNFVIFQDSTNMITWFITPNGGNLAMTGLPYGVTLDDPSREQEFYSGVENKTWHTYTPSQVAYFLSQDTLPTGYTYDKWQFSNNAYPEYFQRTEPVSCTAEEILNILTNQVSPPSQDSIYDDPNVPLDTSIQFRLNSYSARYGKAYASASFPSSLRDKRIEMIVEFYDQVGSEIYHFNYTTDNQYQVVSEGDTRNVKKITAVAYAMGANGLVKSTPDYLAFNEDGSPDTNFDPDKIGNDDELHIQKFYSYFLFDHGYFKWDVDISPVNWVFDIKVEYRVGDDADYWDKQYKVFSNVPVSTNQFDFSIKENGKKVTPVFAYIQCKRMTNYGYYKGNYYRYDIEKGILDPWTPDEGTEWGPDDDPDSDEGTPTDPDSPPSVGGDISLDDLISIIGQIKNVILSIISACGAIPSLFSTCFSFLPSIYARGFTALILLSLFVGAIKIIRG